MPGAAVNDDAPVLVLRERTLAEAHAWHEGYRAALSGAQRVLMELSGDPLLAGEPYAAINAKLGELAQASANGRALLVKS